MSATDSHLISNTGHITISTAVNHAPVLTVPSTNVSASAGQTIQAGTLFSATDQDGDPLLYYLYDGTSDPNSGHWVVNGTVVAANTTYTITAAQLAQTSFVAGTVSDYIFMSATDTHLISNTGHITISTAVNHAPVLSVPSTNVSASAGQTIQAGTLFSAADQDGDALLYYLYDGTADSNSGHWVVNGTVVAANTTYTITAAQLAQTSFVTGTVSDDIFMSATDTHLISNTGHIKINVGPAQNPLAQAGPANSDMADAFVFRSDFGQQPADGSTAHNLAGANILDALPELNAIIHDALGQIEASIDAALHVNLPVHADLDHWLL
jgi:hypothetical protein